MWDEEGPALIGSPLGASLAFLLAQHKKELGTKHVIEVVIFRDDLPDDKKPSVQLLFKIKDVPDPDAMIDAQSGHVLKMRSAVLDDKPRNKICVHKIFQDTGLITGRA